MTQVSLETLVASAHAGLLVSFPTDTVPALAAKPEKASLIFAAKQRSQDKPLILMAASAEDLWPYVKGSEDEYKIWQEVVDKYWPGSIDVSLASEHSGAKSYEPQ